VINTIPNTVMLRKLNCHCSVDGDMCSCFNHKSWTLSQFVNIGLSTSRPNSADEQSTPLAVGLNVESSVANIHSPTHDVTDDSVGQWCVVRYKGK